MKSFIKTVGILLVMLLSISSFTATTLAVETPRTIGYQGFLQKNNEDVNNSLDIIFNLYDASTGGSSLWTESHTGANDVNIQNGYFSVSLGSITTIPTTIDFSETYYLEINVDGSTLSPRQQLDSVPYARIALGTEVRTVAPTTTINGAMYFDPTGTGNLYIYDESTATWSTTTTSLDKAYDAFGAASSTITIDNAEGQLGGLIFNNTGTESISFQDSGTDILTIADGGNVGIGTTTPGAKLHTLGTTEQLRLGYDASNYLSFTVASDGDTTITSTGTSGDLVFSPGGDVNISNGQLIGSHGNGQITNLVMGTSAVASGSGINNVVLGATAGVGGDSRSVTIGYSADGDHETVTIGENAYGEYRSVAIGRNADGQRGVAIGYGATVSLNNANATAIGYGAVATAAGQFVSSMRSMYLGGVVSATPGTAASINAQGGMGTDVAGADLVIAGGIGTGNGAGGILSFKTAPAGASSSNPNSLVTAMMIDSDGNVGIGTDSPESLFQVDRDQNASTEVAVVNQNSGSSARAAIRLYNDQSNLSTLADTAAIYFGSSGHSSVANNLRLANNISTGDIDFYAGGAVRMFIEDSGNVGIGTTTPSAKLHTLATTEQLRLGYDASNYLSTTVGSGGDTTFAQTGDVLIFQNAIDSTTGFQVLDTDGGTPIFNVDTTNERVGIGINAPEYSLHVLDTGPTLFLEQANSAAAQIFFRRDGHNPYANITWGSEANTLKLYTAYTIKLQSATTKIDATTALIVNTDQLYVKGDTGNVGIGTTNPGGALDSTLSIRRNTATQSSNTIGYGLSINRINSDTASWFLGSDTSNNAVFSKNGAFSLRIGQQVGDTFTDQMTIDSSGNVGIDTTTPSAKLHTLATTEQLRLGYDASNYLSTTVGSGGDTTFAQTGDVLIFQNAIDSTTGFQILDTDGGTPIFNVDTTNERVGIGTDSPASSLHIYNSGPSLRLETTDGANPSILFTRTGSNPYTSITKNSSSMDYYAHGGHKFTAYNGIYILQVGGQSDLTVSLPNDDQKLTWGAVDDSSILYDGTNMVFNSREVGTGDFVFSGGNVGIGTTTPAQKLHVYRSDAGAPVRFEDSDGYCEIDPTTTTWSCTSDRSLKKNINSFNASTTLDHILRLNPVTFEWKSDNTNTERTGLIAQEVEDIIPSLVRTDKDTGLKSVAYGGFIPYIISAIQELSAKIDALASQIGGGVANGITAAGEFVDGVFGRLSVKDEFCLDGACINGDQFRSLLESNNIDFDSETDNSNQDNVNSGGSDSNSDGNENEVDNSEDEEENGEEVIVEDDTSDESGEVSGEGESITDTNTEDESSDGTSIEDNQNDTGNETTEAVDAPNESSNENTDEEDPEEPEEEENETEITPEPEIEDEV